MSLQLQSPPHLPQCNSPTHVTHTYARYFSHTCNDTLPQAWALEVRVRYSALIWLLEKERGREREGEREREREREREGGREQGFA